MAAESAQGQHPNPRIGGCAAIASAPVRVARRCGDRFPVGLTKGYAHDRNPSVRVPHVQRVPVNNNDPRCVEVATNVPGKVAVRNSATGQSVEFTAVEWTDFLAGAKLGEFDLSA